MQKNNIKEIPELEEKTESLSDCEKALTYYCNELINNAKEFDKTTNRGKKKRLIKEAERIKKNLDTVSGLIRSKKGVENC